MLASDVKRLYEAYAKIYAPKFETVLDELSDEHVNELTDDLIEEVVEEVFYECLEEGYDINDVENILLESLENSINALNEAVLMELNPYAPAGSKESGEYNKSTTSSKRSAERSAKRAEVIGKVKEKVKKVGDTIKQKASSAAVSAYAAGKMAKDAASPALKAAGKAALHGAGKVAGKAVKYAKKAGEAVSAGYKEGSAGSSNSDSGSDSESSSSSGSSSSSSGGSRGSLRSAAGNLLKRGIKKVLGVGARAVAGAARGVHGLADKAAKRLGEEVVDEAKAIGSAKSTDTNPKGAAVRASSGRGMTMTPAKGLGASKSTANNPAADDLRKKYFDKQAKEDRKSAAKDRAASGEDRVGKLIRSVQNSHYQPENIYDLVLEYLMTGGHVDNLEEAHYVMSQLSDEYIQSVVEGIMPEPIDPVAHKTAQKTQKVYNLGKGTNNPNESQSALKRTGPQLPGV